MEIMEVIMDFNHYYTNEELETVLQGWALAYPNLAAVTQIGESYEKRPLWLLTLTNQAKGADTDKPAVWLDANIHATELTGTTVTLYIAYQLLENYGKDERITRLLDHHVYYILPRFNPDGAALAMAPNPRFIRSGSRPYPYEDKQEGLHDEDLDGDGRILQMRIPDPNGEWKISSQDPRLMEKRGPDENGGSYYRLLSEGRLEKYDGWLIKDPPPLEGLDFNRNFPFEWRPEGVQHGAGPYPASEPEIRAVVDFIARHTNISLAVTYHTFSGVILRPYSTKPDDQMPTDDLWVYQKIGKRGTDLTGYRNVSVFHDFLYHPKEVTTGAFDDWMYDHLGVFAFTIELWDLPSAAGIKERKFTEWFRDHPHEQDVQIFKWIDEHAPEYYVPWYSFNHPQLGPVELGGWNFLYSFRNPPPTILEAEAVRQYPFALALGEMLPRISVLDLSAAPLGGGSYHINLVVENTGFLPTYTSQQGKARAALRPVLVDLKLGEGVNLVQGKLRVELGHLEGRSTKFAVSQVSGFSPTDNRARAEWVVQSHNPGSLELDILCPRGGHLKRRISLG
jgi:murein tripeptide amidase MpaA